MAARLTVSYNSFKYLGGPIKDFIVEGLEAVVAASRDDDRRLSMALWELGVVHLSRFANPDSSIERGLECIRRSAESGDPRAQATAHRLHESFHGNVNGNGKSRKQYRIPHHTHVKYLQAAACAGSAIATAELQLLDVSLAEEAQATYAASYYGTLTTHVDLKINLSDDSALHRAAAMGEVADVEYLLANELIDVDHRNADLETPLLSACRFGQIKTALLLLQNGADPSLVNNLGENGLHFAWCFDTSSSKMIVEELIDKGASLEAKAKARHVLPTMDLLPICSGTPIQRAAARRRLDLVLLFQDRQNTIKPGNGNTARWILLWALRLHDPALLEFILDFSTHHSSRKANLTPIFKARWHCQGGRRTMIEAACSGWVSGTYNGCDLPLQFWLACSFGKEWRSAIKTSLKIFVEFILRPEYEYNLEPSLDRAILWAFGESYYDALTSLLDIKFRQTSGTRSHLRNLDAFQWTLNAINVSNVCVTTSPTTYCLLYSTC